MLYRSPVVLTWLVALTLLTCTQLAAAEVEVVLRNGQIHRAERVERAEGTVVLHFAQGSLRVLENEIASVREPSATTQETAARELKQVRVQIGEWDLETQIPVEYKRSSSSDEKVTSFVSNDQNCSIRLAASSSDLELWLLPKSVKQHHEATYPGYETLGERFTQLGDHATWWLSFSYRRGNRTWRECQGFLALPDGILVLSATSGSEEDPVWIVECVGKRLKFR